MRNDVVFRIYHTINTNFKPSVTLWAKFSFEIVLIAWYIDAILEFRNYLIIGVSKGEVSYELCYHNRTVNEEIQKFHFR